MITSIRNLANRNEIAFNVYEGIKKLYYSNSKDINIIKKRFKKRLGRELEIENPQLYNDKLQWLKVNWYDPLATKCADKYLVREFVSDTIGPQYLNELYEVYESVDEIQIDKLPNSFVLKGTHGSGFNIVCEDKSKIDWNEQFKKMRRWLKTDYYLGNREWVYKDIKPRIICEKFIKQGKGLELQDYRFFCFNGDPKFITVDFSINDKKKTRRNLYDLDWNLMDEEISYPKDLNINVKRPGKLQEMIELSRKLSSPFPHARVDFYYIDSKILLGEITFFHQGGMGNITPRAFEQKMGKWLELPR